MQKGTLNTGEQQSSAEFFAHDGIFTLDSAQWFRVVNSLTNLQVCNNYLVGATSKNTLIRTSTVPPYNISEIEISRLSDDRVHNIFLDPMGWHTVISMQSGTNFYINKGMKKVRPLNKTKDHLFDSIAWNHHNVNELSTQEILIGTNDGLIFETMLMFNEDSFFSSGTIEQYWIQMINLGHSVTGVEVIRFPIGSPNVLVGEPQRCVVFATTPCRMYQFAGWINTNSSTTGSILSHLAANTATSSISNAINAYTGGHRSSLVNEYNQQQSVGIQNTTIFPIITGLFSSVFNSDDKLPVGSKVTEFPGSFGYSDLKLYRNVKDELPSKFAWMTGPGVYFGYIRTEQLSMPPFTKLSTNDQPIDVKSFPNEVVSLLPTATDNTDDPNRPKDIFSGRGVNLTRNTKLIPYPIIHMLERPGVPLGICLTEFHLIIIYVDRIKAVNTLDGRAVYSMPLNNIIGCERALGISRDSLSSHIWIFSNNHLARLNMKNELCRIWQIYLDRLQFDEARQFCQFFNSSSIHSTLQYFNRLTMSINQLTQEQWDDLFHKYKSLRESNNIAWDDIKSALELVGVSLAGHEIRDLLGQQRNWLNPDEFHELYKKAKDMKDTTKAISKALLLKHAEDVKSFTVGKNDTDTRHSVSKAEERGFTLWINKRLGHDVELQDGILPVDPSVDGQLYQRCKNGILLCKLVNVASPNTIDERSINRGPSLKNVFNVHENLTLAVNSAASIGCCVVNTGPEDIMQGKRHIVLGLIWQLIRRGLIDTITLNRHKELIALLHDGETAEDLSTLKPEELLMRWVNYHLHRAGCDRRITNFNSDLADSVVYAHLMEQIVPIDKRCKLMSASEILSSTSRQERAMNVLNNNETLGTPFTLSPEDIYLAGEKNNDNRDRLNLAFLATLFNMYPGLDARRDDFIVEGETLEERTYRNWINSLGVKPYVTHLYTDLSNGLVLLQLFEKIKPGSVDWSLVDQDFDPKRRLFQETGNCNLVIDSAQSMNIRFVNVSGKDIQKRDRKLVLGVCFTLMQAYIFKLLHEVTPGGIDIPHDDRDILTWVNGQMNEAKAKPIHSFRDPALATGIPILQLLEHIKPNSTNKEIWLGNNVDDASIRQYAISCCHKAGARVFTLPEHLEELNGKMILTLFASLQLLYYNLKQKAENKHNRTKNTELKWLKLNDDNKINGTE